VNSQEILLILILGTLSFLLITAALIIFLIYYKRKQQHHITEKMNLEYQYQSELLQTRLEVQEQAFKYLSEEIHDNVGQALSMVKLQLYALSQLTTSSTKKLIESTSEVLGKAINDLRNISHNLHGGYVSQHGLQEALEKEVAYIKGAKAVNAKLTIIGDTYNLSKEKELLVFRIMQEALNNSVKHSESQNLFVGLEYFPQSFSAIVQDDGKGFQLDQPQIEGLGLNNMRVRATLLNAQLQIKTSAAGTSIILTIPTKEMYEETKDQSSIGG